MPLQAQTSFANVLMKYRLRLVGYTCTRHDIVTWLADLSTLLETIAEYCYVV